MTTPVITSRTRSDGERMEMTTPVITKKVRFRVRIACFNFLRVSEILVVYRFGP